MLGSYQESRENCLSFQAGLTLNPIGYHFFSHMGWKPSFPILIKLQTKHHETSHKMLE